MFTKTDTNKVKGVAILLLIFHHMFRTVGDIHNKESVALLLSDNTLSQIAFCCRICVFMFCFLSAYGISLQLENRKLDLRYFAYRSWRLLAPYWFTLTLLIVAFSVWQWSFLPANYGGNLIFALADYIPVLDIIGLSNAMLNGVFWYMNFTLMLIAVLPFVYKLTERFGGLVICATILLYSFIPTVVKSPYGGSYNNYVFAVELGIIFAMKDCFSVINGIYGRMNTVSRLILGILLLCISGACPYVAWFKLNSNPLGIKPLLHTVGGLSMIVFVYLFTSNKFIERPLEFFGKYSFDAFLIHVIVYSHLNFVLVKLHYIGLQYFFSVTCVMAISYFLYFAKKYTKWLTLISTVSDKILSFKTKP